jgi:hypothetical protein
MASIPVLVLNCNPGALAATYTTASFTPVAGTKLVVFGVAYRATAMTVKPTITDSAGLTWTEMGNVKASVFVNPDLWTVGWISSTIGASPPAMTVTVAQTGAAGVTACVLSVLAADTDGTVVQVAYGEDLAAGDPSYTFAATPGASNLVIGCNWHGGGNSIAKPAAYTDLFNLTPTNLTVRRVEVHYDNTSAAKGPNQSISTNVRSIVMAVELGFAAAPSGRAKVWSGSAWVQKPAKVWSGSAWVAKPVKIWNGSAWV